MQAMDQRAIDGASGGSARRSDCWCERWVKDLKEERQIMQAMDQRAIGEAVDGDGWCERWIRGL